MTETLETTEARPRDERLDGTAGLSRRAVLIGATAVAGAGVLAACAPSGTSGSSQPSGTSGTTPSPTEGSAGSTSGLVALADVPVGGAVAATDAGGDPILIAQPEEGQVVAFSAICTHMGCTVAPDGEELLCPCHGSVFDLATGTNLSGPAPRPLDAVAVRIDGDQVIEG